MKIRKAKKEDIPELIKIVKGERMIEDFPGQYSEKMFRNMLKNKGNLFLVCFENKAIGFCVSFYNKEHKRIYLDSVAVAKKYRRKGIANFLLSEAEKRGKKEGAKKIELFVRAENKSMNMLAKKRNYKLKERFSRWEGNL